MKYLGIDYGTKRIGIAASDESGALAFPLLSIAAGPEAVQEIVAIAQKEGAQKVVLGESRDFKGRENAVMQDIAAFKSALEQTGLAVTYEPEFMTSAQAQREGGSSDIDAAAAALILQSYLDRMK